mmetsp:Transcript_87437/g.189421  ORF Transcript_87437/g.189421 Transcript_87437/m.189421 type:complete len:273 (+) Transcript_87437:2-820(+)
MAVLPTPGSPMNTGLFFWRRARIWMARSISSSRPTSGSIMPSMACFVRSLPNSSRALIVFFPSLSPPATASSLPASSPWAPYSSRMSMGICCTSTLSASKTFRTPSSLAFPTRARRMWAGSMTFMSVFSASLTLAARYFLAAGEKGISAGTCPLPLPTISSTALRAAAMSTLFFFITWPETPDDSAMTPTRSSSLVTVFWPRRRASSCAFQTTFSAFSENFSNIMLIEETVELRGLVGAAAVTMPAIEEPRKEEAPDETATEPATEKVPAEA